MTVDRSCAWRLESPELGAPGMLVLIDIGPILKVDGHRQHDGGDGLPQARHPRLDGCISVERPARTARRNHAKAVPPCFLVVNSLLTKSAWRVARQPPMKKVARVW